MTQTEFLIACGNVNIDPWIALECGEVVKDLREKDDKAVAKALLENF